MYALNLPMHGLSAYNSTLFLPGIHCFDQVNTKHAVLMDYLYSLHSIIIRVILYSRDRVFQVQVSDHYKIDSFLIYVVVANSFIVCIQ